MSALYVRNTFRTWIAEVSVDTGLAQYDTINLEQTPTEDVYLTYSFASEFHEGTFCEPGYIENGFIYLYAVAAPGTGDEEAVLALETAVPALFAKTDANLALTTYDPIEEESAGSADKDYRLMVTFSYKYSL